jgi:3-isopropylmalate/(R)-2-methylmalate dehydratase small subunit
LLPVMLPAEQVQVLLDRTRERTRLTVDLQACEVRDDAGLRFPFSIDDFSRHRLLNGLDDIGLTLQHEDAIAAYELARQI